MMGIQGGQIQMVILDIDSIIPENHLLRQIKRACLQFIYSCACRDLADLHGKFVAKILFVKYNVLYK
ncbi:MAG: hypothetical protein HFH80_08140 [Lachnospiraceae bacterium]|nr:hypothetical protein [Lachnospiraceae bacterium]